ncbi:hypothetical protein, partial [Chromobacterium piscinae]|uniref:hypothetical protein n=1 Tax=Chromobacterium piscinae TaxID=686831 RepID=UPI00320A0803
SIIAPPQHVLTAGICNLPIPLDQPTLAQRQQRPLVAAECLPTTEAPSARFSIHQVLKHLYVGGAHGPGLAFTTGAILGHAVS